MKNNNLHSNAHNGAQEKTRTSTGLPPQAPEACASTNSATWAHNRQIITAFVSTPTNILAAGEKPQERRVNKHPRRRCQPASP